MHWFIASILAGFFFAASRVVSRAVLRKAGNPLAFTAIHDFISGLALVPFFFIGFSLPDQPITWLYFIGVVIFLFLTDWFAFSALKLIDVSLYQIVNQVRHVLILVGGLLIFSENITLIKIISVALIIIGVFIALYEGSKLIFNRGIAYSVFSSVFAVVGFLLSKLVVEDFAVVPAASFELMGIGLLSFIFLGMRVSKVKTEISINKWGLVLAGVLFAGFEVLLFTGLQAGEASKVIPVTQSSLIFAVLAGIMFLNERSNLVQKSLGVLIVGAGIVLMYAV
ncbi:MAG: DMT family transporter [bacterium]